MRTPRTSEKEFKKRFSNDSTCLKALLEYRMNKERQCFKCEFSIDKYYKPLKTRKCFLCTSCLAHIYPGAASLFDHAHISLKDFFEIIFKMLFSRNGISAVEIARTYGFTERTASRIMHAIREQMEMCLNFELENSVVEVDESYVSTGNKGMGRHFKFKTGRGSERHTSILCIVERRGYAKLFVIPATDADSIIPIILSNVPTSTIVYTDQWHAYNKLQELGYEHAIVNHTIEFVNDSASTNCAENIFSNLKRVIVGTHRNVSHHKLQNYLTEAAFRHSYRFEKDFGFEFFMQSLSPLSEAYTKKSAA